MNEDTETTVEMGGSNLIEPTALESIERAQIDMQIATAKRYPRDMHHVKQEMVSLATLDRETAEACFYSLPRGGKQIQGPGVRMAEIAVHCFGNVRSQTRTIDVVATGESPHVTVQSVCADLQRNVAVSIEKRRRILPKKDYQTGGHKPIDEDDINLAVNACAAIAFRDAAFKIIPGALVKPAFVAAKKTAIGDAKTLKSRRVEAVEKLKKMGLDEKRILAVVRRSHVDNVDLNDLETLYGLFTAVRDGQAKLDEAFPEVIDETDGKSRSEKMAEKLSGAGDEKEEPKEEEKKPEPPPTREPGDETEEEKPSKPEGDKPAIEPPEGFKADEWKPGD